MDSRYISIVALALGAVSLILAFALFYSPLAPLIIGIVGIVLGHVANKIEKNPIATTGFILSIVAVVLSAIFLFVTILFVSCASEAALAEISTNGTIADLFKGLK
ncbi:hypothetical protein LJC56_07015 [Christensenellaceae bacterium OttesenSCG-928-K19]|nr:hypothetical protein [Christensenellaceae bacterium OttesenSCG-928-K19]